MDRREVERLLGAIRDARQSGTPVALATIVRVRGNAYRREGTTMVVRGDGTFECTLSGGCLEPSVAEAALKVIATGEPHLLSYDLSDDSLWGLGLGCTGAVDVRIEPLGRDDLTRAWLDVLERGDAAVRVTPLGGGPGRLIVTGDGNIRGHLDAAALEKEAIGLARARLSRPSPRSGAETVSGVELFFEVSGPPPALVIFGAGPDAVPLARQAWTVGFAVTVIDVRDAYLTARWFPTATRILAHFSEFATAVSIPRGAFVVIMNHHVERDAESLRFALGSEAAYIGVLGPKRRFETLRASLAAGGDMPSDALFARVHSPVGLAIGSETPEEVALSILGEVLAVQRGFAGGFLNGSSESLHEPAASRALTRS